MSLHDDAVWERLDRIEARQEEILAFLQRKVAMELESICQGVNGRHADVTVNGDEDGDGRLADQG